MEQVDHKLLHLDPPERGRIPQSLDRGVIENNLNEIGSILLWSVSVHRCVAPRSHLCLRSTLKGDNRVTRLGGILSSGGEFPTERQELGGVTWWSD